MFVEFVDVFRHIRLAPVHYRRLQHHNRQCFSVYSSVIACRLHLPTTQKHKFHHL
ncbi:hypothetical protein HanIR_Chr11g0557621 [Helianthus annuus]|nr:hypothetical protein HanIR_Chr11g0557621 [Helianthus annuus]